MMSKLYFNSMSSVCTLTFDYLEYFRAHILFCHGPGPWFCITIDTMCFVYLQVNSIHFTNSLISSWCTPFLLMIYSQNGYFNKNYRESVPKLLEYPLYLPVCWNVGFSKYPQTWLGGIMFGIYHSRYAIFCSKLTSTRAILFNGRALQFQANIDIIALTVLVYVWMGQIKTLSTDDCVIKAEFMGI